MLKKLILLIGFSFFFNGLQAQSGLNSFTNGTDSLIQARMKARDAEALASKATYNAKSTRFTYEKNFKFNNIVFQNPDTIPDNMHRVSDLEKSGYLIQNLGNVGTAQRSLFFEPGRVIGRTSGYTAYDAFSTSPDQIRYFDTRSPYTDVRAFFAGGGRSITEVTFTFNDSTQFNIGGNFNAIRADKQFAFLTRGDRQVTSNDWNIFGFIRPKGLKKYLMLFNVTQFNHTVVEQGGVVNPIFQPTPDPNANEEAPTYFDYEDASVYLTDAESYDKRGGFHIYQQYDLDSIFQVYHTADYREQLVRYNDVYDLSGFDQYIYSEATPGETTATVAEGTLFRAISNELGLKGRTQKFSYTAYYKNRLITNEIFRTTSKANRTEHYVGGTLRQQITPKLFLKATGEFLFDGNYLLEGDITSDFLDASFTRVVRQPAYLYQQYTGQQQSWENSFNNETSDNIQGTFKLNFGPVSLRPFLKFSRISNYLYFDENRLAAQANNDILLLTTSLNFDFKILPKVTWSNTIHYNSVSGGSASLFRIPEFLALSQLAFKNEVFGGKMIIHTGVEAHYRTAYEAMAYDPIIQQFHLQNGFLNDAFLKADVFLNFKVGNFLFLLKMAHFNQSGTNGYFISPEYAGTKRTVDMGVRWLFFD